MTAICQTAGSAITMKPEVADGKCSERLFVSAADLSPLDTFTRNDGTSLRAAPAGSERHLTIFES